MNVGLLKSILGGDETDGESDDRACNITGHEWDTSISGYHASGVPHFGFGDSWQIEKKYHKQCKKCGRSKFPKETIGKVRVDKETDELTVVQ